MWAVDCGADAIGLIFAKSPRQVTEEQARAVREKLPPFISAIGVFVDPDPESTRQIFDRLQLDFIQFHGSNEAKFLEKSGITPDKLIRVISIASEADLETLEKVIAGTVLLDTKVEGMAGGTGKTFDWNIAAKAQSYKKPIILAGGLNPENVEEAVRVASPQAVDVSSGVEAAPGRKDPEKVRDFIRRAKGNAT